MSECNRCTVPYAEHEAALARQKRANRRLWIVCIILIIALITTNVAWIMYESQYETAVADKNSVDIFSVMDELMQSVRSICPRLYEATIRKLESIE